MSVSSSPEKPQMDESDGKKWVVVAGITLRRPLKPIFTAVENRHEEQHYEEECSTTPTSEAERIPLRLPCPAAPKKRKSPSRWHFGAATREFFTPPDLDSVFIRRVDWA
ncbi:hypothetical protein NMG60_11030809 [Bertholletia excelsa]